MKSPVLLLLLTWLCAAPLLRAQTQHAVFPNVADPLSGSPNNLHFAYVNPAAAPKNKLFLFFPGTGAVPANYQLITQHAANLGYHAVGLTYPNTLAINALCSEVADTTCHRRARLEVFDGTDRHPGLAVDSLNCIQRRALKLLQYLDARFPTENWGQYYAGNTLLWPKIIVTGHSQGGGHAGLISKIKPVDRVVLLAATDWVTPLNRPADWITATGPTAAHRYYGFIHQRDESLAFALQLRTWDRYGLNAFGAAVLTDAGAAPYNNAHQLYTQLTPANDPTKFHSAVAADAYTPMAGAVPVYQPVWTYLIDSPLKPLATVRRPAAPSVSVYPNPFQHQLSVSPAVPNATYTLVDLYGRLVQNGTLNGQFVKTEHLRAGVYLFCLYTADGARIHSSTIVRH